MSRSCTFLALAMLIALTACRKQPKAPGSDLQVLAERVAVSKSWTPRDILPYNEAMAWHEYAVKRVLDGKLDATKIRVAHWTVVAGKPVPLGTKLHEEVTLSLRSFADVRGLDGVAKSDDLDPVEAPPRFLDQTQTLTMPQSPQAMRHDYNGSLSEQMLLYWKLRSQLRLVAMGNSLSTKAVCTRMFFPDENTFTPVALNLAPAGATNAMQCLMIREYLLPLPKLQWVVWVVSGRNFNARRDESRLFNQFLASPGWKQDQKEKATLWPAPVPAIPVTVEELSKMNVSAFDLWGWEDRKQVNHLAPDGPAEVVRAHHLKKMSAPDFSWSDPCWREFTDAVRALNARGVKVLLITTPMHPLVKEAKAAGPDGTSHEGNADMVRRLEALDQELTLTWFRDFNRDGRHDYAEDEFYDADHLNRKGSFRMTERLMQWMETCKAP